MAKTLLDWAEAHVLRGEADDLVRAQSLYGQTLDMFQEMGADGYVSIVKSRLKALQLKTTHQVMAHYEITQELAQAGRIQGSFLPDEIPNIPGYGLAAILEPARETSGDFYDFIPLPEGRLGILIADVADKGAAAALYMASSRTLIRTFSQEYPAQPEKVINSANRRLLKDTHSGLFVTIFYGILEPATGAFTYCNAGHNPPCLFRRQKEDAVTTLPRTGTALGILEEAIWESDRILFKQGDVLILYTDGVTEAQDAQGNFFGEQRLYKSAKTAVGSLKYIYAKEGQENPAQNIFDRILKDVHEFVGKTPKSDDLTLMILTRL